MIVPREAKGNKDGVVMQPKPLAVPLRDQIAMARRMWEQDRATGAGDVEVLHALETE